MCAKASTFPLEMTSAQPYPVQYQLSGGQPTGAASL